VDQVQIEEAEGSGVDRCEQRLAVAVCLPLTTQLFAPASPSAYIPTRANDSAEVDSSLASARSVSREKNRWNRACAERRPSFLVFL